MFRSGENIFGHGLSPYNRPLAPGDGSGGESALIAREPTRGTDIGGSHPDGIRIPLCAPLEIVLIPVFWCYELVPGGGIQSVLGPIASCIAALRLFAKTVVDSIPWNLDPACPRLPWNADYRASPSHGGPAVKLCFAIMWDDDVVKPTPAMK
ncbi:hypothetical protein BS47DRAFT_1046067 [Hydnum rufescens UP504]|uniref:Amidase domain-containing protein n=1 Tax=Hydnum rufescens UP504 TaxID=1448309 RepID=A0A9P6DWC1_9AGAM|nr:hypothetical protein BS47DRAFT_1046067 [Hydnum rufescens UP504]